MVLDLGNGRYLHTAYSKTNIPEEMIGDVWSLTDQDGMNYYGQYEDDSNVDSNDPADYVWTELLDTEVNDETEDGIWPLPSEQVQIDALQDQVSILQSEKENLQASIVNAEYNIASNAEITNATADIAKATNQHFWTDDNGVHVSNEENNPEGDRNTLFNSIGMIFRKGANYLTAILAGGDSGTEPKGLAIYDGSGNDASNVVASFTDGGAVIGKNAEGESRSEIATNGMRIIQNVSGNDTLIANLGYGETNSGGSLTTKPFYSLGSRRVTTNTYDPTSAYTLGSLCVGPDGRIYVCIYAIGSGGEPWNPSHWQFYIGKYSTVEGEYNIASGEYSHAEGSTTYALGDKSHAEGELSKAVGWLSHAEGANSYASGQGSHAEGQSTTAGGDYSHAEGIVSRAYGDYAHAQNSHTIASSDAQTSIGKYNSADGNDTYAFIIGNGTDDNSRSNALTVAWNGDVETAGGVTATDDISTSGDVSVVNISASGDATITGDISSDNITTSGDATITGDLSADNISASGDITAAGGIIVNNHTGGIGEIVESYLTSSTTATSGTWTTVCTVTLTPGIWLLVATARFVTTSASGGRYVSLEPSATTHATSASVPGSTISPQIVKCTRIYRQSSATQAYYFSIMQTSGSAMTVDAGTANGSNSLRAVRIA